MAPVPDDRRDDLMLFLEDAAAFDIPKTPLVKKNGRNDTDIHGTSKFLEGGDTLLGVAIFKRFAPAPCILFSCYNSSFVQARQYFHVFDNRIEYNLPWSEWCCCTTTEACVHDRVRARFFDSCPFRSGYFYCAPYLYCGPPAVFAMAPKFCGDRLDLTQVFGESIYFAPWSFWGLKLGICVGPPIYSLPCWRMPLIWGLDNAAEVLRAMEQAVSDYQSRTGLRSVEMATFNVININEFNDNDNQK